MLWLTTGDNNSKLFHQKASTHIHKNKIQKLQNMDGKWKESNQLNDLIIDCFHSIFTTSNLSGSVDFLESLIGCVMEPMNDELSRDFTREEIYSAL